jgi:hypothetical protein
VDDIISVDIKTLITVVIIAAVETIGFVQWAKSFGKCASKGRDCHLCRVCNRRGKYAIWSIATLVPCAIMNTTLVGPLPTAVFDIAMLGLATTQLAWTSITNGVPNLINAIFDKAAGMRGLGTGGSDSKTNSGGE